MDEQNNVSTTGAEQTTADTENEPETVSGENAAENGENAAGATAAGSDGQSAPEGDASEGGSGNQTGDAQTSFLKIRFNHEDRDLTESEAREFAQKGIKYQSTMDMLEYAAAMSGKPVKEYIQEIVSKPENEYRAKLQEMYGEDSEEVEIGMNVYRAKHKADYQKFLDNMKAEEEQAAEKEKTDIRTRLADEYIELKSDVPDAPEYAQLPDSVIKEAATGKRDLLSAYLRWERKEKAKIEAAKKAEETANNATAGGMKSSENENASLVDEFTKGLKG